MSACPLPASHVHRPGSRGPNTSALSNQSSAPAARRDCFPSRPSRMSACPLPASHVHRPGSRGPNTSALSNQSSAPAARPRSNPFLLAVPIPSRALTPTPPRFLLTKGERIHFDDCCSLPSGNTRSDRAAGRDCCVFASSWRKPRARGLS
jgi:hypothetical protein